MAMFDPEQVDRLGGSDELIHEWSAYGHSTLVCHDEGPRLCRADQCCRSRPDGRLQSNEAKAKTTEAKAEAKAAERRALDVKSEAER